MKRRNEQVIEGQSYLLVESEGVDGNACKGCPGDDDNELCEALGNDCVGGPYIWKTLLKPKAKAES